MLNDQAQPAPYIRRERLWRRDDDGRRVAVLWRRRSDACSRAPALAFSLRSPFHYFRPSFLSLYANTPFPVILSLPFIFLIRRFISPFSLGRRKRTRNSIFLPCAADRKYAYERANSFLPVLFTHIYLEHEGISIILHERRRFLLTTEIKLQVCKFFISFSFLVYLKC